MEVLLPSKYIGLMTVKKLNHPVKFLSETRQELQCSRLEALFSNTWEITLVLLQIKLAGEILPRL